ncbi:uncharacterized protein LOC131003488 [Salvia miltiorrhiza]|uniref:uncharacterized protein LOC131003488 n=1 Tax=Salvia miltiorrhiza TaxID=226208 RepID=UPI0025ACDCEF|nr:uncharacterized protein LOC131003488 [Salvia miltiorrhiza]
MPSPIYHISSLTHLFYSCSVMASPNDAASNMLTNSCWKKPCEEGGSVWGNFKNQLNHFVHTPVKDHTHCFKLALLTVKDKFSTPAKWTVDQNSSDLGANDSMELPWDRDFTSVC